MKPANAEDLAPRVGVLLVGGFLGAGKTTLVTRLMRDPELGPRLAVVVNELGPLGLDGELIASGSDPAALRTVQLDNGCICCTLQGSLGETLTALARPAAGTPPAVILVELSGAALASEVHFQVGTQALDPAAPYVSDGLVCVVDAAAAPRWHAREPGLFEDQLRRADLVLLSKLDSATPAEQAATTALITAVAPRALVVPCSFGAIDPAQLFGIGIEREGEHAPTPTPHRHGLSGRTVRLDAPVARAALEALLDDASPALYRIKGRVALVSEPAVVVQCVGEQIELSPFVSASDDDAPSRLTFIGRPADVAAWADAAQLGARLGVAATAV